EDQPEKRTEDDIFEQRVDHARPLVGEGRHRRACEGPHRWADGFAPCSRAAYEYHARHPAAFPHQRPAASRFIRGRHEPTDWRGATAAGDTGRRVGDVTSGSARHGRRNNGLFAAEYAVVGDVDPRIGEHLLDVLGNRGIAAYLQPSADQHPITRLTTLPGRPVDRLYVDRRELSTAQEFFAKATADTASAIDPDGLSALRPPAPAAPPNG